jgi:hypothetical protein
VDPRTRTATQGRYYVSYTWSWKARALNGLRRWPEAAAAWQNAIDFDDNKDPELRKGLQASRAKAK